VNRLKTSGKIFVSWSSFFFGVVTIFAASLAIPRAFTVNLRPTLALVVHPVAPPTVSPEAFGARGNGITDDRAAFQSAVDSLSNGGVVSCVADHRYLMDSYITSAAGDNFNVVTSHDNITFQSCYAFQGPNGWGTNSHRTFGPIAVFNTQAFLPSLIGMNGYQNTKQNGGYYPLTGGIAAGGTSVTFRNSGDSAHFVNGDWMAVSLTTDQKVEPLEINQVVTSSQGVAKLRWPQTVAYATAYAANVTSLVRSNITFINCVLRGATAMFMNDVYNVKIIDSQLLADTTYSGPSNAHPMFANSVRSLILKNTLIASYPEGSAKHGLELPQNNSIDVLIDNCKVEMSSAGAGEYNEHWRIVNNIFTMTGDNPVTITGYDILIQGNSIESTFPVTYFVIQDYSTAPNLYKWPFGVIKIIGNKAIEGHGGRSVVRVVLSDTEVSLNQIIGGSGQSAILGQTSSSVAPTNTFSGNWLKCTSVGIFGCVLINGHAIDGGIYTNNIILGSGTNGVVIQDPASPPATGTFVFGNNYVQGFANPVSVTAVNHPGMHYF
jgi:hypothetical protein